MKECNLDTKKKIIRETFNDVRPIKCITSEDRPENICPPLEGDLFITECGEFIYFGFHEHDFTEDDLVRFIEFAEAMYEKHQRKISIYVICPENARVWVRECEIRSKADFTIRLARNGPISPHKILDAIKMRLIRDRYLDGDDIEILKRLPEICEPEERSYFLREYFRIISRI